MASTVKHQPNAATYIEVVAGTTNDFFLQNVSKDKTPVMIIWGTSLPAPEDRGHILQPGDSVVRAGLTGNVYARAMTSDAIVAVTEE